jgi:hypothetical protein
MRYLILLAYFLGAQVLAMADTAVLPPDVASFLANEQNGVSDEGTIESGSNSSGEFVRYVRGNWKVYSCEFIRHSPGPQTAMSYHGGRRVSSAK